MENLTISNSVIALLTAELFFSVIVPVAAVIIWKVKTKSSLAPVGMGAAAFFVFAMVLEQLVHYLVLGVNPAVASAVTGNPWLYALYGGLAAGVFEETARFLVFKTMMRKYTGRENAVSYGLGHGGIECILILGMAMLSNLVMAGMFNGLGAEEFIAQYAPDQAQAMLQAVEQINAINPPLAVLACVERLCAIVLQVELSVFVFAAVRLEKTWMFPLAILLHMGIDFFAALYQAGMLPSLYVLEAALIVYVVLLVFPTRKLYRALPSENTPALDRFGRTLRR